MFNVGFDVGAVRVAQTVGSVTDAVGALSIPKGAPSKLGTARLRPATALGRERKPVVGFAIDPKTLGIGTTPQKIRA